MFEKDEMIVKVQLNGFDIYIHGNKDIYFMFHFQHIVNQNINADLYRIIRAYVTKRKSESDFTILFNGEPIVGDGEWECAVKEKGQRILSEALTEMKY